MLTVLAALCGLVTAALSQQNGFQLSDHTGLSNASRPGDSSIRTSLVHYADGDLQLTGYLATPADIGTGSRPGILVAHDFNGRDEFEDGKAADLARLGYVAFAYDVYGKVGATPAESMGLMKPFTQDRQFYMKRVLLSLEQLKRAPGVDQNQLGAIGFCFGGTGVLDMARTNVPGVQAVVTFHGVLEPLPTKSLDPVHAKLLVCHGGNDSSVTPDKVLAFENEISHRAADWQVVVYGNGTNHGFTVPGARFHPESARRAWREMTNHFTDVFGTKPVKSA